MPLILPISKKYVFIAFKIGITISYGRITKRLYRVSIYPPFTVKVVLIIFILFRKYFSILIAKLSRRLWISLTSSNSRSLDNRKVKIKYKVNSKTRKYLALLHWENKTVKTARKNEWNRLILVF